MKKRLCSIILLSLVGFITFFGCDNFTQNISTTDAKSTSKSLEKYNYIFRVVDMSSSSSRSVFAEKVGAYENKLEQLASVFANIDAENTSNRSLDSTNPIISNLAHTAFTAYTTPEVLDIVTQLASEDIYIQFSYKEFLIEQCEPYNSNRSVHSSYTSSIKNVIEFDGSNTNPTQWTRKAETITFIETATTARTLEYAEPTEVTLQIIPENKAIVDEYMQEYSEILLADQNSVVTEQSDGTYIIANGYMETLVETTDISVTASVNRGFFDSIKKAVQKVVTKIKTHPVASVIAIGLTVVSIASGAGLITLPAGMVVAGSGLSGSIGFVFFL